MCFIDALLLHLILNFYSQGRVVYQLNAKVYQLLRCNMPSQLA